MIVYKIQKKCILYTEAFLCDFTSLCEFVSKKIEEELVQELSFLANYDNTKMAIQGIIDMPDRLIDLFIQLCLQNNGSISARKKSAHFDFLTNEELSVMEQAVKDGYNLEAKASN